MTTTDLSDLIASADPAMVVVTTSDGHEHGGCLVGFHGQASIDPPRYAVWLSKANHTYRLAVHASHLAVHFLAEDQVDLAVWFGARSGDQADKLAPLATSDRLGVRLLDDCPNRFVGERVTLLDDGGDHVAVVLAPVLVEGAGPFAPLRLSAVEELDPGHDADERHRPPTERAAPGELGEADSDA